VSERLAARLKRSIRAGFQSDLRPGERRLIQGEALRLRGQSPDKQLSLWERNSGWGRYTGVAKLTNQRFLYAEPWARRNSAVIELQHVTELHIHKGYFGRIYVFIHDAGQGWLTFRLTSYGGWQRHLRALAAVETFRLVER
jgi:hypothetical protein